MMQLSQKALSVKESSTLAITARAKEMQAQGVDVIGFGAGEPDFPTPLHINNAAIAAINADFTKYTPSSGTIELRKAICDKLKRDNGLGYDYTQIVVSNGAKHSLTNIFTALLNPGDEVLVPAPFWLSYVQMVHIAGGVAKIVYAEAKNNFKITKENLESGFNDRTKAIILNTPNNPTGMVYNANELQSIADFAVAHNLYVISDEIYEDLIYDGIKHISIASLNQEIFSRTIIVNGFSKSYSMTGWRIGYTASSKELAAVMGNVQSHSTSNPNSIAQKAAYAAITGGQACVAVMREEFRNRRDYIYDRINAIPQFGIIKPEGAFYAFVNITELCGKTFDGIKINNAADFAEVLLTSAGVAVVPCADFGFDKFIRLSYAISMNEIKKGMDRIEAFIKKYN